MKPYELGHYFEDFHEGDVIQHSLSKTIFESDNNLFCLLTMNPHPVHTNADYASKAHHGRILVVGTLVFSLVVGMTVQDISGKAIANLGYESVKHLAPVFVGDTLYATTAILDCRPSKSKGDRGIVRVKTIAYNQDNVDVLQFTRSILVKKRCNTVEPECKHEFFKCQVPAGDSCVPIYHQVCMVCRWDETRGCVMPADIWDGWAIPTLKEMGL